MKVIPVILALVLALVLLRDVGELPGGEGVTGRTVGAVVGFQLSVVLFLALVAKVLGWLFGIGGDTYDPSIDRCCRDIAKALDTKVEIYCDGHTYRAGRLRDDRR